MLKLGRADFIGKKILVLGAGISGRAAAEVLARHVSGSDLQQSEITDRFVKKGARVCIGQCPENLQDAQVVIISSAIKEDNPELVEARRRNLPVFHRSDALLTIMTTMYGFAYVDKNGVVISLEPQIKGVSVPLMTGKKMDTVLLGDTITDDSIRAALAYLDSLSPEILRNIAEINVGNPNKITAYTNDSIPIRLGNGDDPAERAKVTEELLQEVQSNRLDVQYIDSDIHAGPVYFWQGGTDFAGSTRAGQQGGTHFIHTGWCGQRGIEPGQSRLPGLFGRSDGK